MTELELNVAPLIIVPVRDEEDRQFTWGEINQYGEYDIATIKDDDLIQLTAEHMDMTVEDLTHLVYGEGHQGRLKVATPETGNKVISPETRLG